MKSFSPLCMSSIGGGNMDNNPGDSDGADSPLNEWMSRKDTENVRRAREQFAEGRLPISYGAMNVEKEEDMDRQETRKGKFGPLGNSTEQPRADGAIDAPSQSSSSALTRARPNPYLSVVSRLTPSDLISRFTSTASPRVQDAVRTTVLGLIGGLPQMAFETKTIATGERLASLMFQLQMTGYMFKNAEYRLSLSQSLGRIDRMLPGGVGEDGYTEENRVRGKIKVRYGGSMNANYGMNDSGSEGDGNESSKGQQPISTISTSPGMEVEVDAQAYMSELRGEVSRLREDLDVARQAKEEEIRKDLLTYIRTLPQQELQQLTETMSSEVLEAMKGLVTAVLAGIGDDENTDKDLEDKIANKIGPETVTEQSGEALAQLCMWQLIVGFNLRELEVREEFRASMGNMLGEREGTNMRDSDGSDKGVGDGSVQFGPGALE